MDTKAISWGKFREGAEIKNLSEDQLQVDIIRLALNTSFDEHVHQKTEWLYILEGEFSDAAGTYSKGHFVVNKKGSKHATKSGPNGCLVFSIRIVAS